MSSSSLARTGAASRNSRKASKSAFFTISSLGSCVGWSIVLAPGMNVHDAPGRARLLDVLALELAQLLVVGNESALLHVDDHPARLHQPATGPGFCLRLLERGNPAVHE